MPLISAAMQLPVWPAAHGEDDVTTEGGGKKAVGGWGGGQAQRRLIKKWFACVCVCVQAPEA